MKHTQVTMPLTKSVGLIGEFEGEPSCTKAGRLSVEGFNSQTAMCADRFIYATGEVFPWVRKDGEICGVVELLEALKARQGRPSSRAGGTPKGHTGEEASGRCDSLRNGRTQQVG